MTNLTQVKIDTKQGYLNNKREQMLNLYQNADTNERNAVIGHIDSFLSTSNQDQKTFWLKFRRKLEIINEKSFLFPLGSIVITIGAKETLKESNQEAFEFLKRHQRGDWGDICKDDAEENNFSLKNGYRLLSVYNTTKETKLWIITEADRSLTTVLLPSEY